MNLLFALSSRYSIALVCTDHKSPFQNNSNERKDLAMSLYHATGYSIMPMRHIYPDQFKPDSQSVEAKKALLVSLTPLLVQAEADRLAESKACEEFTRCRVVKVKGNRNVCYSYCDVDNEDVVPWEDFEMRYVSIRQILMLVTQSQVLIVFGQHSRNIEWKSCHTLNCSSDLTVGGSFSRIISGDTRLHPRW